MRICARVCVTVGNFYFDSLSYFSVQTDVPRSAERFLQHVRTYITRKSKTYFEN